MKAPEAQSTTTSESPKEVKKETPLEVLEAKMTTELAGLHKQFDLIKWVIGSFTAMAALLIGAHVYIANSNYDHERQTLSDQMKALSAQLSSEQDVAIKALNDKLSGAILQKLDGEMAAQETNITARMMILAETRRQVDEVATNINDIVDQKVGLGMASGFVNVAATLARYKQYALATQCYLNAGHQFMIGEDFTKLRTCVNALWKTCLPHMKREEFVGLEKAQYELDLLIYALSSFKDKRFYDDLTSLKYERKRLLGDDFPSTFKPNEKDEHFVQMLQSATGGVFQ